MSDREEALDELIETARQLATEQYRDPDPAHEDFRAWGWVLSELTYRLGDICRILDRQIGCYGDLRILRDDEGFDPAARLDTVHELLDRLAGELEEANATARAFHAQVGHIGVEVDPDAQG